MSLGQQLDLEAADRLWHLRQAKLIDGWDLEGLTFLADNSSDRVFSAGEVIFEKGDSADHLYLLNRGYVQIAVDNDSGREKVVTFLTNGDVFGESLLGPSRTHRVEARAHDECWITSISRDRLFELLRRSRTVTENLLGILSQRLVETQSEIEALAFMETELRLARMLLLLAERHGKKMPGTGETVKLKLILTHEHLARLIGANRPHVSTIMSTFRKRGWIDYSGRKLSLRVQALEQLVPVKHFSTM